MCISFTTSSKAIALFMFSQLIFPLQIDLSMAIVAHCSISLSVQFMEMHLNLCIQNGMMQSTFQPLSNRHSFATSWKIWCAHSTAIITNSYNDVIAYIYLFMRWNITIDCLFCSRAFGWFHFICRFGRTFYLLRLMIINAEISFLFLHRILSHFMSNH